MNRIAKRCLVLALLACSALVLAAGCGVLPGDEQPNDEQPDDEQADDNRTSGSFEVRAFGDDTVVAPEPTFETRTNELAANATQFVYVNFDGVTVSDCERASYCSDATENRSSIVRTHFGETSIRFERYGDASERALIIGELERAFDAYNVKFVTRRPERVDYNMLVIAPNDGPVLGVAPLDCGNRWTSDIAYVYRATEFSAQTIANAAVHEIGHSFGLTHVRHNEAYMHWTVGDHDQRFIRAQWDAEHTDTKCMSGDVQDPDALLRASVGEKPATQCATSERVAGRSRHETAAAISRWLYSGGADVAVLVHDADANPDALAAGPLAYRLGGPLLLTGRDHMPPATAEELVRLGASQVVIVGGSGAVSEDVADELRARGLLVERISGTSRFGTAAAVARRMGAPNGVAFIASGDDRHLVDALAATGAAGKMHAPILLVPKDGSLPDATRDALGDLGIERTIVVGGKGPVPERTVAALPDPQRVSGASRYETAVAIAKFGMSQGLSSQEVLIARADKAPDALAAGASGKLMLLASPTELPTASWIFLEENASRAVLLGGQGALDDEVARNVCQAL